LKAIATCAFFVGGRWSDWTRLDWSDVDFDRHLIFFRLGKNKHPREVPIIEGLMWVALNEAMNDHDAMCPGQTAVFTYQGERMTNCGRAWDKACVRAGFPGLHFHDLRRSANKRMRDSGVSQGVRMKIMGHRTAAMDLRYGTTDRSDLDDAREKMKPASETLPPHRGLKRVK